MQKDSSQAAADLDLSGRTFGEFRVLRRLGSGGMGQVYLAEQLSLKRRVALKIMRGDLSAGSVALKRFQTEAEMIARITHANIVQVYAIGSADGLHYMALEYVDGKNLREFLEKKGPPGLPLALSIMKQVAAGLERASEAGVVHRDIKPENVLVTRKGEVKVADFGLSRCFVDNQPLHLTQTGMTMGTPLYMSPEQVQGKEVDPRSDIYSFGITCYHLLAGEPPFKGQVAFEVAQQHVSKDPAPLASLRPDLPADLCAMVHKMMAKDPAQRYQSSRELLKALLAIEERVGSPAPPGMVLSQSTQVATPGSFRVPGFSGTVTDALPTLRRWWATALLGLLVALAVGAGLRMLRGRPAAPEASLSQPLIFLAPADREKALLDAAKAPFKPDDPAAVRAALAAAIDLGQFYLRQNRPQDAQTYFRSLADRPPEGTKAFRVLGQLGQAIALAAQDRAEESNALILEIEQEARRPDGPPAEWLTSNPEYLLLHVPELRQQVSRALSANAAKLGKPLPEPLERLRKLPAPPAPARPGGA